MNRLFVGKLRVVVIPLILYSLALTLYDLTGPGGLNQVTNGAFISCLYFCVMTTTLTNTTTCLTGDLN